jgi:Putative polyhydroxyalkanoic acid system protein (PHA_gran_rgn)
VRGCARKQEAEIFMELSHNHNFDENEARERVRALADYMQNKHGMQVTWNGDDAMHLRGKYTVVSIDAQVTLKPGCVYVQGKDPGMMLRSTAKKYVGSKLETYLDPRVPLDQLPRS